jgi:hypothetical protein
MQLEDLGAEGGEHAADLVEAAFGEDQTAVVRIEDFKSGRQAGTEFTFEDEVAGGEAWDPRFLEGLIDGELVGFFDVMFGGSPAMDEVAEVGDEEEAGGVAVESADGSDGGISLGPAGREEVVDGGIFAGVVGAGAAGGFMEEGEQAIGGFEGLAIDAEQVGGMAFGGIADGQAGVEGDTAAADQGTGLSSGGVATAGEELVEARRARGGGRGRRRGHGGRDQRVAGTVFWRRRRSGSLGWVVMATE